MSFQIPDQHTRHTVLCGECVATMRTIPAGIVDAVVTDPPYSSGGLFTGQRTQSARSKYVTSDAQHDLADFPGDTRDQFSYMEWCHLWLSQAQRVAKGGALIMVFTDWRQLAATQTALQVGGFVMRGVFAWVKPNARPQKGRFAQNSEFVVWGSNGDRALDYKSDEDAPHGYWMGMPPTNNKREHITQKPVDLMRYLMRPLQADSLILDPFMGSGTTGVAAMIDGHRFIGIDQSEHYTQVAEARIIKAAGEADPNSEQAAIDFTALTGGTDAA